MRFLFRLALALGRTVSELLDSLTGRELALWRAFYRIEPWGDAPADERAGNIAAMLGNVNLRRGGRRFKASDFSTRQAPIARPSMAALSAKLNAIFGAMSAKGGTPCR